MIKVLDSSLNVLAILQNVVSPVLSEDINREFTFAFSTVIDMDKSQYITYTNKVEVEDNYFNIVYFKKNRTMDNITLDVSCEHVSYDLLSANFTAGFTATGVFSAVATTVLSGTGFMIGTVEITASQTISINEATNGRNIMFQLAALYGGELKFDKYAISLLTRRGADNGVQFRYRKNISAASVIVDNRKKVGGLPTISYEVNVAELEFEQSYISKGYSSLERYELGDTVRVIDEDLDIDISLRIVKESHDTEQRMQGTVEISNFVDDISDTLTQIQTTSVAKNNIYNGCSIGPDDGFVAERSDNIVKTSMNATNGIEIDIKPIATASYSAVFYVQIDTATGTAKLYLAGDAVFTGEVIASDFIGGTITIGTGSDTFNANGTDGIWLGFSAFASAPFSVTLSGAATADNLLLTGGEITIGTSNNTFRFTESDGLWMGNIVFVSAPFRVTMSGAITASNLDMTGGNISGGTINISSDATIGNNLYLGDLSTLDEKGIYFYASGSDIASIITNDIGDISFGTFETMSISGIKGMNLTTLEAMFISGFENFSIYGGNGSSTADSTIEHDGSGILYISHAGSGVMKLICNNDISITPGTGDILYLDKNVKVGDSVSSQVGFFGTNPVSKDTVANQAVTTSVETVLAKLNELIDSLQSYGLV